MHSDNFFQFLLFPEPGARFGMDLVSLNIQRGREHGIPSYNRWREWCGLHTINTWDDLLSVMANHSVRGYAEVSRSFHPPVACQNTTCPLQNGAAFITFTISKQVLQIYESPEDLDLWSAGVTERPLPGSMVSLINHHTIKQELRISSSLILIVLGWSHLGVHHWEAVPQLPTGRQILVRERRLAFLLHSRAGQLPFKFVENCFLAQMYCQHDLWNHVNSPNIKGLNFLVPGLTSLIQRPFPSSWTKSGG